MSWWKRGNNPGVRNGLGNLGAYFCWKVLSANLLFLHFFYSHFQKYLAPSILNFAMQIEWFCSFPSLSNVTNLLLWTPFPILLPLFIYDSFLYGHIHLFSFKQGSVAEGNMYVFYQPSLIRRSMYLSFYICIWIIGSFPPKNFYADLY